jgi:hypothetical protein
VKVAENGGGFDMNDAIFVIRLFAILGLCN